MSISPAPTTTTQTSLTSGHLFLLPLSPNQANHNITRVTQPKTIPFYGSLSTLLNHRLHDFSIQLAENTDGDVTSITNTLRSVLSQSLTDCSTPKESCWFEVRMTTPDPAYVTPRWHYDGPMFDADDKDPHTGRRRSIRAKYATVLLGPATRFLDVPHTSELASCLKYDEDDMLQRQAVDKYLASYPGVERVHAQPGQIARFAWGQELGGVHSEPDMSGSDRVFVSVLFGSEREIRDLAENPRYGRNGVYEA
ncbi:hypothetical protein PMZ80_001099 [Knufia obscura]|uniref:Uncharacterized protein n=1 Tax=Knufia obscura TaxID=1635080 RepID=A0ABR0S3C7_9EURO|nr:hypothetical protein PMZ80_001099 [Knufia obscura]